MHKIFLIFAILLVIERSLEQITDDFIPKKKRRKTIWILSTILSLVITFVEKIGILKEPGNLQGKREIFYFLEYFLTGLIISSSSEPVPSLIVALEYKKEELKQKAKIEKI